MPAKDDEIGGLWARTSANGADFLSGKLTIDGKPIEVVVFRNSHKQEGERTPDWRVYKSQPRADAGQASAPRPGPPQGGYRAERPSPRQVDRAVVAQAPAGGRGRVLPTPADDDLDDSIPF